MLSIHREKKIVRWRSQRESEPPFHPLAEMRKLHQESSNLFTCRKLVYSFSSYLLCQREGDALHPPLFGVIVQKCNPIYGNLNPHFSLWLKCASFTKRIEICLLAGSLYIVSHPITCAKEREMRCIPLSLAPATGIEPITAP